MEKDFKRSYDVIVVGAGIAGIAAAVAASRANCKVAIVEKAYVPGGLVTAGGVIWYYPIGDIYGNQVTHGLAEDLLTESEKYGGKFKKPTEHFDPRTWANNPSLKPKWLKGTRTSKYVYNGVVSRNLYMLTLDEFLLKHNIDTWYDTRGCDAILKGNRVVGIEAETTGGKYQMNAKIVIDATGSADIAFRAGAPCRVPKNQVGYYLYTDVATKKKKLRGLNKIGGYGGFTGYGVGDYFTEYILESRKHLLGKLDKVHEKFGKENIKSYGWSSTYSHLRRTRGIIGQDKLKEENANKHISDSVGVILDWTIRNKIYELPYGMHLPKDIQGLLIGGRSVSVDDNPQTWHAVRMIPGCAHTGEIAGVIAGLCVKKNTIPDNLDIKHVQQELAKVGVKNHYDFLPENK